MKLGPIMRYSMSAVLFAIKCSGVLAATLLLSACSPAMPESYQPLPTPTPLKAIQLYDQNGQTVTQDSFKGQWNLVFFGYTYCPDVCPMTLGELNKVAAGLNRDDVKVVLVSVDPERDTPQQLKTYIEYFNPKFNAWSGELAQVESIARQMHVFFQKQEMEGTYLMDHSSQVILVNPKGEYQGFFTAPLNVDDVVGYVDAL